MLIDLVSIHPSPSPQSIPLANAFLKAYASSSSVSINLIDFFVGDNPVTCAAKLVEQHPYAVGFSIYLWNRDLSCKIAFELRRTYPYVKIICGGPEVTADPESFFCLEIFDFIISGEGESPFLSLCQNLAADRENFTIPGVMTPGETHPPPPLSIDDLDSIPSPYLTGIIDTHATPGILWQLSRGCSFTCDFCFDSRGIRGVRRFSLERVKAELLHFAVSGVTQIFVLDSTFNNDMKRAKKILRMIGSCAEGIHFHFEVRSEFIDREMAQLFAAIPCSLQIGLQSSEKNVLQQVGRSFDKRDFTSKIGLLNECGATFGFDLMYGLPGDTLEGFCGTLNFALSLYPNHLDIFPLAVLPGTTLAFQGNSLHLKWNSVPPYLLEESSSFSTADMASAARLAAACDIFYTRGKAVAWFNALIDLLGLSAVDFLNKFNDWLVKEHGHDRKEADFTDAEIFRMQQLFLNQLLGSKKVKRFLPVLLDIVNYHYHYSAALLAPPPKIIKKLPIPSQLHTTVFTLAQSVQIVRFSYEIEELLASGEPRIAWMYDHFAQSGSQAVIYNNGEMVCTESLANPYIILLEQIRDGGSIDIAQAGLTGAEADDFLVFAIREGIIRNRF